MTFMKTLSEMVHSKLYFFTSECSYCISNVFFLKLAKSKVFCKCKLLSICGATGHSQCSDEGNAAARSVKLDQNDFGQIITDVLNVHLLQFLNQQQLVIPVFAMICEGIVVWVSNRQTGLTPLAFNSLFFS